MKARIVRYGDYYYVQKKILFWWFTVRHLVYHGVSLDFHYRSWDVKRFESVEHAESFIEVCKVRIFYDRGKNPLKVIKTINQGVNYVKQ